MAIRYPIKVTGNVRGQSGNLATQLDTALVALGWTIQASASNRRIYAPGAGGTGMCFYLDDNAISSSREAVARIVQPTSTLPSTLVNPCPSTTQRPNATCRIRKSASSDATDRPYWIVGDDRFFILTIDHDASSQHREVYWFGDLEGGLPGDAYNAVAMVRNQTDDNGSGQTINQAIGTVYQATPNGNTLFCARNLGGTAISDYAGLVPLGNGSITYGIGAYPHPFTTGLHYAPMPVISSGVNNATSSTAGAPRGMLPFVFDAFTVNGIGTLNDGDEWTDTAYDPGGLFELRNTSTTPTAAQATGFLVFQTDGAWDPQAMRPI